MSERRINPAVEMFRGINNALNPCSAQYRQFTAYDAQNSRINESGIWDKAAALSATSMGSAVLRNLPGVTPGTDHPQFKNCTIGTLNCIVGHLKYNTSVDVGPNKYAYFVDDTLGSRKVYWWDGTDAATATYWSSNSGSRNYDIAGMGRPTLTIAVVTNTGVDAAAYGGRMERGVYYYMYTYYDSERQCESLPSKVVDWLAPSWMTWNTVSSTKFPIITITPATEAHPALGSGRCNSTTKVRIYRTKRTYEPDRAIHGPADFYYIGEIDYNASAMTLNDYAHDSELVDRYEGRGSCPPTTIDVLAAFNNRMYYFKGNVAYWSSAGRPDEVAQEYTLTYSLTNPASGARMETTFPMQPLLAGGMQGEAKYEISELAGQTITAAYSFDGKLWIWTETTTGYLLATMASEGVKYVQVRRGFGCVSDKTLAHTPYGIFGADREGVWVLDNMSILMRLSKGRIDINTAAKSTYFSQADLHLTFGVWVAALDEYWWCGYYGSTYHQIAYQPLRRIWGGIYAYSGLKGGCAIITSGGAQCYLTGAVTPIVSDVQSLAQVLDFWMGQHSIESVKENLRIEIIYESVTADLDVTVDVHQNNIASTTGAQANAGNIHNDGNLVGVVDCTGSGRMFLVRISIPATCRAPVIAIGYEAEHVYWAEKHGR